MIKVTKQYVDHLWYPILLKVQNSAYHRIVELQGSDINRWNDSIAERAENLKIVDTI